MIASKVICDDTYSNKSWCVVGQGMFSLREINQMEREMCSYLEWILNVKPEELAEFEADVKRDYATGGAKVVGQPVTPPAVIAQPTSTTRPVLPAPVAPAARAMSSLNPYPSPESSPPSPSHSESSSPASSEPRTPPSQEDDDPASRSSVPTRPVKVAPISSQKISSVAPNVQVKVIEERLPRSQSFAFASASEW
jgi:hypothetical protein